MLVMLAFLNIPMYSTVLLLLAGVLVGYAICFPFRTDSDEVAYELHEVRRQNQSLQNTLRSQQQAYTRLEVKHSEQLNEWTSLRESHRKLETAWRDFGKDQEQMGHSLEGLRRTSQEANELARREKAERAALEQKLRAAEDTIDKLRVSNEEYRKLKDTGPVLTSNEKADGGQETAIRGELREAREQLAAQQREIEAFAAARDGAAGSKSEERESNLLLRKKLDESRGLVRKQRKQLESVTQQREHAIKLKSVLDKELENGEALRNELMAARDELTKAQTESKQLSSLRQELLTEQATAKSVTAELHTARHELESAHAQLRNTEADRDDALAAHLEAAEQCKNFCHRVNEFEEELARTQNQRADLVVELRQQQRDNTELKRKIAEQQSEIEAFGGTTAQLENLESDRNNLISKLGKRREQLRLTEVEKKEAFEINAKLLADNEQLVAASRQRSEQVEKVRGQREEILARLRREEARRKQMQCTIEESQEEMIELRKQLQRLQAADNKQRDLRESLADTRDRLQQLTLERNAAFSADSNAREDVAKRTRKLQELIDTQVPRISELETECAQLRDRLARQDEAVRSHETQLQKSVLDHDSAVASLGQAEKTIDELRKILDTKEETVDWLQREMDDLKTKLIRKERENSGNTRRDKRRGVVYVNPPKDKDDLKEIAGIASVLESKLNDFGIYTYKQIMEWDDTATREFSNLLAFRDRIEREHWIDQARKLYHKKYGSRAA